jgi:hypothetical protein
MHKVNYKDTHESTDDYKAWNFEIEGQSTGQLELASPTSLARDETLFALSMYASLSSDFSTVGETDGRGSGTHIHVDAKCLLKDQRRLLALLLIWERFYKGLVKVMHADRRCLKQYAGSLTEVMPDFVKKLRKLWSTSAPDLNLKSYFADVAKQLPPPSKKVEEYCKAPDMVKNTGLRNFGMNICHVLDVDCCRDCDKNNVPKFGALEFRIFKASLGNALQNQTKLVQRLIQSACGWKLNKLNKMIISEDLKQEDNIDDLLRFLKIGRSKFLEAFHHTPVST